MHLLLEERQINGLHRLKIVFAVLVLRRIDTVDEIVIHGEHFGLDTIDEQLDLQTLGESSLTGRRRT